MGEKWREEKLMKLEEKGKTKGRGLEEKKQQQCEREEGERDSSIV